MDKNVVIGAAFGYTVAQIYPWLKSLKDTGYTGNIALVVSDMEIDQINELYQLGVSLHVVGTKIGEKYVMDHSNNAPHVSRFFYIWQSLEHYDPTGNAIVTDVRDVIFQQNPFTNLFGTERNVLFSATEGLKYKHEVWGTQNISKALGEFFSVRMMDEEICNVGVFGGSTHYTRAVCLMLYLLSNNKGVVDQAYYNLAIHTNMIETYRVTNDFGWATNLGTTIHAVEQGSGDLGLLCKIYPDQLDVYKKNYLYKQPIISNDGVVLNSGGSPFAIVHQYDRVPSLNKIIQEKYEYGKKV